MQIMPIFHQIYSWVLEIFFDALVNFFFLILFHLLLVYRRSTDFFKCYLFINLILIFITCYFRFSLSIIINHLQTTAFLFLILFFFAAPARTFSTMLNRNVYIASTLVLFLIFKNTVTSSSLSTMFAIGLVCFGRFLLLD